MRSLARRRRERLLRPPAIDDPENEERRRRAFMIMRSFDALGPTTRQAIRATRFDVADKDLMSAYISLGGRPPFPDEDGRSAKEITRADECYSGSFGPRSAGGI